MSLRTKIKKVGAAAAGTLMVGATLGAAVSLADYPSPFVEDGEVQSSKQIVVGSQGTNPAGLASDIVGGIDIAASLGNKAVKTETKEKTVSTEGSVGGWSASEGITLDTRNDDVFFGQNINTVRETLTEGDVEFLEDTEFEDDSGTTYDVTHNLNVGDMTVTAGKNTDELDGEDPALHLEIPTESSVSASEYVLHLQGSMDSIDVEDPDVAGEEITLFGKDYTIASDHSEDGNENREYLKLYGASQEIDVQTGESETIEVDGQEVEIEVVSVQSGGDGDLSVRVDGEISSEEEGGTINIDGTDSELRVDELINIGSNDDGQGIAKFDIGSEELRVYSEEAIEDDDGNDYEGTYAVINDNGNWDTGTEISSMDIYVGGEDDDQDTLLSGDTYSHSLFEQAEFHFGGMNPNAAEDEESSGEIVFSTSSDDTVTVSLETRGGDSASLEWAYSTDSTTGGNIGLQNSDEEKIAVQEGEPVKEDDYFAADAGDFSHLYKVTSIDRDTTTSGDFESDDEAEIDLKDAVSGNSVTVELDYEGDENEHVYEGTEIIDGQKYFFELDAEANDPSLYVAWGEGADYDGGSGGINDLTVGDQTTLYAAQDTESDAAVAFTEKVEPISNVETTDGSTETFKLELPSTESTDTKVATVELTGNDDGTAGGVDDYDVTVDGTSELTGSTGGNFDFTVGQVTYRGDLTVGGETADSSSGNATATLEISLPSDIEDGDDDDGTASLGPAALAIQPEDDNDEEHAYLVVPGTDENDEEVGVTDEGDIYYTGGPNGVSYGDTTETMESDDDMEVGYNFYGTYTEEDTDDQGDFSLSVPFGQSTAGAAVTDRNGALSSEGGSGSQTIEYTETTASGVPSMGMLDSSEGVSSAKTSKNLILVGGPAVNALTSELATQDNSTVWGQDTWTDGEHEDMSQLVLVEDAFTDGKVALVVAGHEAEDTRAASKVLANSDSEAYADLFTENTTEITLSKSEYTTAWSN